MEQSEANIKSVVESETIQKVIHQGYQPYKYEDYWINIVNLTDFLTKQYIYLEYYYFDVEVDSKEIYKSRFTASHRSSEVVTREDVLEFISDSECEIRRSVSLEGLTKNLYHCGGKSIHNFSLVKTT